MRMREKRAGQRSAALFNIVACKARGAEWMNDPAIKVACSECEAGQPCRWQQPHGYGFHMRRDLLAMREGHLSACDALTWNGRHSRHAIAVTASVQLALL